MPLRKFLKNACCEIEFGALNCYVKEKLWKSVLIDISLLAQANFVF